jgi:hypothetical protein
MSSLRSLTAAAGLVLALSTGNVAYPQAARGGGAANAQLLQQLQQLASERTSMQAENARLNKQLDDLRKERDSLQSGQKALDQRTKASAVALAQSTSQRDALEQELKQTKDKMQELVAKFRETVQTMREIETDRTSTKQTLATRERELNVCMDHNRALFKLNGEVLTRLDNQSVWSRVAAAEPFTKLKRVELENLVDDYKARADDQRLTPETLKATAAQPMKSAPVTPPAPPEPTPAAAPQPPATPTTTRQ